jgi:hypothetical protein
MATPRLCSVEGCDKRHSGHGYCGMHLQRVRRHGDPNAHPSNRGEPMKFILGVALPFKRDECLEWPFCKNFGYGIVRHEGRSTGSHRLVCELAHGPAPHPKAEAAHSCGNRICCNPHHLRWATRIENQADRLQHGTHNRGSKQGQSKLTEEDVRKIRALRGSMTEREIAKLFDIGRRHVNDIHRRVCWSWLD